MYYYKLCYKWQKVPEKNIFFKFKKYNKLYCAQIVEHKNTYRDTFHRFDTLTEDTA